MIRVSSLEAGPPSFGLPDFFEVSPNFSSMRGLKAEQPHGALYGALVAIG